MRIFASVKNNCIYCVLSLTNSNNQLLRWSDRSLLLRLCNPHESCQKHVMVEELLGFTYRRQINFCHEQRQSLVWLLAGSGQCPFLVIPSWWCDTPKGHGGCGEWDTRGGACSHTCACVGPHSYKRTWRYTQHGRGGSSFSTTVE